MQGRARLKQAAREVGIGAGAALVLLLLVMRGSVAAAEFAFLALSLAALYWIATVPLGRIMTDAGRPRLMVFGSLSVLVLVAALSVAILAELLILAALPVLVATLLVGVWRIGRRSTGA